MARPGTRGSAAAARSGGGGGGAGTAQGAKKAAKRTKKNQKAEPEVENASLAALPPAVTPQLLTLLDVGDICRLGRVSR
jgi:hypothetical protein